MAHKFTPNDTLTSALSAASKRGHLDVIADITDRLESSEKLTVGSAVVSPLDTDLISISQQTVNTVQVGAVGVGKGVQIGLDALKEVTKRKSFVDIEYEGDSNSKGVKRFEITVVDKDE